MSWERCYSCPSSSLDGAVCGEGCAKALSVPLVPSDVGPGLSGAGAGLELAVAASLGAASSYRPGKCPPGSTLPEKYWF